MKGALITLVSLILLVGYCVYQGNIKAAKYKAISNEMSALVEDCKKKGSNGIYIRDKILVLDLERNVKSDIHHERIPKKWNLLEIPSEKKITVLMIMGNQNPKVDTSSVLLRKDSRQHIDIAVANWPEKEPVGFLSLFCEDDAREQRLERQKIDLNDPSKSTNKWIESVICPKVTITEQEIVNDVKGLVDSCRRAGKNIIINERKALVWDMDKKTRSSAHKKLPVTLKASSDDNRIAVFMIVGKRDKIIGTYSISGEPAIRQYIDIAVAYWPEKKPVGFFSVVSNEPRSRRPVQHKPEYGDPDMPITKWIESVVKEK